MRTPILLAVMAAASVLFTSPTTITRSGFSAAITGSRSRMTCGHLRVGAARADVQEDVRHQAELLEEHIGHVRAEVLAGVHDAHVDRAALGAATF
jgi:hypothetical protein